MFFDDIWLIVFYLKIKQLLLKVAIVQHMIQTAYRDKQGKNKIYKKCLGQKFLDGNYVISCIALLLLPDRGLAGQKLLFLHLVLGGVKDHTSFVEFERRSHVNENDNSYDSSRCKQNRKRGTSNCNIERSRVSTRILLEKLFFTLMLNYRVEGKLRFLGL